MAWTNLTFAYGSKLTSTQMTQMFDNFAALAAGSSGAPAITAGINGSQITNATVTSAKLKTVADTTGASGSINAGSHAHIALQDYCFAQNLYASRADETYVCMHDTSTADTTTRLGLKNTSDATSSYVVRYRYVTSSDKPFIYAIQNKDTGEIIALWACDDPPPEYWGLDDVPEGFIPPILCAENGFGKGHKDHDELTLFNVDRDLVIGLGEKAHRDRKMPFEILSMEFEYDKGSKLFKSKNLEMI